MIRLEVKVEIPDNRKKEDFLKLLLHSGQDNDVFLWQNSFDIKEMERATFEAVLGEGGFPFLEGCKLLCITCDFANKKQAMVACEFFRTLATGWEIEINEFEGKRLYNDILDMDDLESI